MSTTTRVECLLIVEASVFAIVEASVFPLGKPVGLWYNGDNHNFGLQ